MSISQEKSPTTHRRSGESASLRDHIAIVALSHIMACRLNETSEKKALEAYQIADAMRNPPGL